MTVRPVFIMSLPRSGSTLLQRILAAHPQVGTSAEPWLLLPAVYALRPHGGQAEYGHRTAARALEDFCASLPEGRDAYLEEVAGAALALYARHAGDAAWFVDKTPRYHLIVDEVMSMFPQGRFIFLWRNPLSVAASMIESFGRGRWNLDRYSLDLFGGLDRLVTAYERGDPRARAVRYEDLVADPGAVTDALFRLLDLEPQPDAPAHYSDVDLGGRMGDRTGRHRYSSVSAEPVDRWRATMRNPLRKRWCAGYLRWIGAERLAVMGYDLDDLEEHLSTIHPSTSRIASDVARRMYGYTNRRTPWNLTAKPPATTGTGA